MREKLFLHVLHTKGFGLRVMLSLDGIMALRWESLGSCSPAAGEGCELLASTIVSTMVSSCGASVIWSIDMTSDQDGSVVIWCDTMTPYQEDGNYSGDVEKMHEQECIAWVECLFSFSH